MPVEIERKFLVDRDHPDVQALMRQPGLDISQGYIFSGEQGILRVRTMGPKAYLTFKGTSSGLSRAEFEYEIPFDHAQSLLADHCVTRLRKTRWKLPLASGHTAEIDLIGRSSSDQTGLVMAEVELGSETEDFTRPEWMTTEVTGDPAYYNNNLASPVSSRPT